MNEAEAVLAQRLRRMRWLATGLLLAMLVVFVLTSWLEPAHHWLGLPRAFAEAATVGALADWFAVTALFRRPMGLPIPHTAIVPTRKDAIGQALARFVRDHFLVRETVQRRLSRANLAERLGLWLAREDNARAMSRDLARASRWLIEAVDGSDVRSALRTGIRDALEEAPLNTGLAVMVEVLASGRHAQTLIDHLVQFGREQLENNKPRIRERIRERSPWWLPRFVDEQIYDQLVGEFERILNEIGDDPAHEARIQFKERLSALRRSLEEDPRLSGKTSALLNEFLDHPAVSAYLRELGQRLKTYLIASLDDPQSALRLGVEGQIRAIGRALKEDPEAAERLNRWLEEALLYLVENYRGPLSEIVSETIEQWDPSATSQRIELYIGRDLQFIRLNGTLVGGLVGVVIYGLTRLLPP